MRMNKPYKRRIIASLLSITVCLGLACTGTYAWFQAEVVNAGNVIQAAASYTLEVELSGENQSTITKAEDGNVYTVTEAGTYSFILSATGDSTGYSIITVTESGIGENGSDSTTIYYTEQIVSGSSVSLTVNMNAKGTVSFENVWGSYSVAGGEVVKGDESTGAIIIGTLSEQSILSLTKPNGSNTGDGTGVDGDDNTGGEDTNTGGDDGSAEGSDNAGSAEGSDSAGGDDGSAEGSDSAGGDDSNTEGSDSDSGADGVDAGAGEADADAEDSGDNGSNNGSADDSGDNGSDNGSTGDADNGGENPDNGDGNTDSDGQ